MHACIYTHTQKQRGGERESVSQKVIETRWKGDGRDGMHACICMGHLPLNRSVTDDRVSHSASMPCMTPSHPCGRGIGKGISSPLPPHSRAQGRQFRLAICCEKYSRPERELNSGPREWHSQMLSTTPASLHNIPNH